MNIYINDETIDFSLEHEKTLYDVLCSLDNELSNSGGSIISVLVNNKSAQYPDESSKTVAIDSIESLRIEADNPVITQITKLKVVLEYINIIEAASNNTSYPSDITHEEIQYIIEYIDTLYASKDVQNAPISQLLQFAFSKIGLLRGEVLLESKEAKTVFAHVRLLLSQKILLLMNPQTCWIEINKLIKKNMAILVHIVEFIYSGQELIAINLFASSIETYIQWLNILASPPNTISDLAQQELWKQQHEEYTVVLRSFFEELSSAMEAKDWITVSDLIEYEISPKTKRYIQIIEDFYPPSTDD